MHLSVLRRVASRFVEIVNETMTSQILHLVHARVHVLVSCFLFLGETLHASDRSNHYLIWLRVEVQKATLSLVTSLRFMTHTRRPMREKLA